MWERFVQKEYHLCNTDEWLGNYKRKYVTEVQRENSRKFNHYGEWILDENHREYEKMINTGKLRVYSSFPPVYHLLNSGECFGEWMESYKQKKHTWKQNEVQVNMPRSSSSSRGAFLKNLFRDKGRTNDPAVFEISWKRLGIKENHQHKKVSHFPYLFNGILFAPFR